MRPAVAAVCFKYQGRLLARILKGVKLSLRVCLVGCGLVFKCCLLADAVTEKLQIWQMEKLFSLKNVKKKFFLKT